MSNMFDKSRHIIELKSTDFSDKNSWELKSKKCAIVAFYSPTCPHCVDMKDSYIEFAQSAKFLDVFAFNRSVNSVLYEKIQFDNPNLIRGVPTFIFYKNGKVLETYQGDRSPSDFLQASMRVCQQ